MKKLGLILSLILFWQIKITAQSALNIIPKPQSIISTGKGNFVIDKNTSLSYDKPSFSSIAVLEQLQRRIQVIQQYSLNITDNKPKKNYISLSFKVLNKPEGYELTVTEKGIEIAAETAVGHFYGYQTLLQMLPAEVYSSSIQANIKLNVPMVSIKDFPRFGHRGIMIDAARHFFPVEFMKKIIDQLALHKLNTLHWHLTDDQGWRIEIKKYPKLTEVGSIRKQTMLGHYTDQKYDGKPYGGFYTQDQIRNLIEYAKERFVTIIPEIEMPGHGLAALASYPELGCGPGPYEVKTNWGVEKNVYCPNEQTFTFLEDVLTEVMDLFPSQYIHIGGDECPKDTWKKSEFCQTLMKKEDLKDEHELQSYFIKRIDKFVSSKGKKIIGWDEILEGGLSENATVMSWRGEAGGIEAAKQKHDVIMTPSTYMYLDYYQAKKITEPLAIGGFLPLEKVYAYEPLSKELKPEQHKYIKGIQANLWTEYIADGQYAEYMLYPRATAMSEIAWSAPNKDFENFKMRLNTQLERYDQLGVNYSKSMYNVRFNTVANAKNMAVANLSSNYNNGIIRYTVDGTTPNEKSLIYDINQKISLSNSKLITAAVFNNSGKMVSKPSSQNFIISKSTLKKYTLKNYPDKFKGTGQYALNDGIRGDIGDDEVWVGLEGKDLEYVVDLGNKMRFTTVGIGFQSNSDSWILGPQTVEIFVSNDNVNFKSVKTIQLGDGSRKAAYVQQINGNVETQNARYVKVKAKHYGKLPEGHQGAGNPSYLFVDEISID